VNNIEQNGSVLNSNNNTQLFDISELSLYRGTAPRSALVIYL